MTPGSSDKAVPIRQVGAKHIGHLVTVQGIVTRVTDVKPRITGEHSRTRSHAHNQA